MPCRSDYMEPTPHEQYCQQTAKLLLAFSKQCNQNTKPGVEESSRNIYAKSDYTDKLCNLITRYPKVYKSFIASDHELAAELHVWWAKHQKVDAERIKKEEEFAKLKELAKQAASKLTIAELNALLVYGKDPRL